MGLARSIPRFRSGEPYTQALTAQRLNQLVDAVNALLQLRGGPGVKVAMTETGVTIGLDLQMILGNGIDARISAVSGGSGPAVASTFTYSVKAFGRPELPEYTGLTPTAGRPVQSGDSTTEIYPAAVGDRCRLFLEPDGDGTSTPKLWIGTETLAFEDCGSAAVAQAQSLSVLALLDVILSDAQGELLTDANGNPLADARLNTIQAASTIDRALTDADGRILTDANGNVLLDANAGAAVAALWDAVLTDANGDPLTDADGNALLDASAMALPT